MLLHQPSTPLLRVGVPGSGPRYCDGSRATIPRPKHDGCCLTDYCRPAHHSTGEYKHVGEVGKCYKYLLLNTTYIVKLALSEASALSLYSCKNEWCIKWFPWKVHVKVQVTAIVSSFASFSPPSHCAVLLEVRVCVHSLPRVHCVAATC